MLDPATQLFLFAICGGLLGAAFWVESQVTGRPTFFSPLVFLVSILIFAYGVRSVLTFNDIDRYSVFRLYYKPQDLTTFVETYLAFIAGVTALIAGYASRTHVLAKNLLPSLTPASRGRLSAVSLLALLGGVGTFALLIPTLLRAGAVLALFAHSSRDALTTEYEGRGGLLFLIVQAPLFLAVYLEAARIRGFGAIRVALIAVFVLVLGVADSFMGSRAGLMSVFLVVVLFIHYRVRPVPLWLQCAFGGAVILATGLLGLLLDGSLRFTGIGDVLTHAFVRFTATFDQFEGLFAYIQKSSHFYFGWSFVEDLFWTYIPRGLFPFKPELFGAVRLENAVFPSLYQIAGISATYPVGFLGEAYGNLQFAGLIVFPFLFGALLRALAIRACREGNGSLGLYHTVVITLLATGPGLARAIGGSLLTICVSILMLKLLFCVRFVRPPKRLTQALA